MPDPNDKEDTLNSATRLLNALVLVGVCITSSGCETQRPPESMPLKQGVVTRVVVFGNCPTQVSFELEGLETIVHCNPVSNDSILMLQAGDKISFSYYRNSIYVDPASIRLHRKIGSR